MLVIDKLAWIELQDKSILATRSYGKDKFYIPGGKREAGETDAQAITREIKEELNIDLKIDSLKFIGVFEAQAHGHATGIIVKMTCYTADYTGTPQATSEIEEIRWLNFADQDIISDVDKIIFEYLRSKELLD